MFTDFNELNLYCVTLQSLQRNNFVSGLLLFTLQRNNFVSGLLLFTLQCFTCFIFASLLLTT